MNTGCGAIGHNLLNCCCGDGNERQVHWRTHSTDTGKGRQAINFGSVWMNGVELACKSGPLQIGQ
jgi:hypothetical protein